MVSESITHEAKDRMGYSVRGHEGERNDNNNNNKTIIVLVKSNLLDKNIETKQL